MDEIFTTIEREIPNRKVIFVFPSDIVASLWARRICEVCNLRSIEKERFIAWDRFKERGVRSELADRKPIDKVLRRLFSLDIIRRNRGAAPLFRALIPPAYADEGGNFAEELAAILPSLGALREREASFQGEPFELDDEDLDYRFLEDEYGKFLETFNLFEPSWEKPPLKDRENTYYLFFPGAIEDFFEYQGALHNAPNIRIVETPDSDTAHLFRFASSAEEIHAAICEIRRLYEEEGIPFEDMAISAPDLDTLEPYLNRELALRHIPARRREGNVLGETGPGRLFSLVQEFTEDNYSFHALKALAMNEQIPWAFPEKNRELVLFGIKHNCVSGYREEDGVLMDVWEEAFNRSPGDKELYDYYRGLKKIALAITGSRDFTGIRMRYFEFRFQFLSMENISPQGDAILSRCVEELSNLIPLEETYGNYIPDNPFSFYLSILREKRYAPRQEEIGISLFPYRVAGGAPFKAHFALNLSQNAASALYRPLAFLRPDKRKRLGAADYDASDQFLRLYGMNSRRAPVRVWMSASDETFAGWAIPHSYFFTPHRDGNFPEISRMRAPQDSDPYTGEQRWWAGEGAFPERIFPRQKEAFLYWREGLLYAAPERFSLLDSPFSQGAAFTDIASEALRTIQYGRRNPIKKNGALTEDAPSDKPENVDSNYTENMDGSELIRVSATDLNDFFFCHARWFLRKIFRLEESFPEARLLDEAFMGNLYHDILKNLFIRIRDEDSRFLSAHLDLYKEWIAEYAGKAVSQFYPFQGPLARPLLEAQASTIVKKLSGFLNVEAKRFDGYSPRVLEWDVEEVYQGALLNGRIDRVSLSPEGERVIVDYKTNSTPSRAESFETPKRALRNFQMPMYTRLFEAQGNTAEAAVFMSLSGNEKNGVAEIFGGRGPDREEYQPTLDALEGYIQVFCGKLGNFDFSPGRFNLKNCASCNYRSVCRTSYELNRTPLRE